MNSFVWVGLTAALAAGAPSYRLRVLPVPDGCIAYSFLGHGLSDSGSVVGTMQCADSPDFKAVAWDDDGLHSLPTLGGRNAYALGISEDGHTIVGMADGGVVAPDGQYVTRPVAWMNGDIVELDTLGGPIGAATNVDRRGTIIGACQSETDPRWNLQPLRACRWDEGVPTDLGELVGPNAVALDVNVRGWIAGWATGAIDAPTADGFSHVAFLHDGSEMKSLGTLGGTWSEASAINAAGEVVGISETDVLQGGGIGEQHGFVWRRGVMSDLGTLSGSFSMAWDIDDGGDIVGTSVVPVPGSRAPRVAVLWRRGTIRNLNDLVDDLGGWRLEDATAIDHHGRILVQARRGTEFVLAILEPHSR